jgi:3-hydroxybutyrate dehydrogenase
MAIADVLARHGSDIVLHGLFPVAEGEQQARALSQRWNVDVHFLNADLANPAEAVGLIDQAVSLHGRLDILVNNAGIQFTAALDDYPLDRWDAIQAVNLRAPFLLTRAVLPHMRRANWGRIVNIASVHGLVASVNKAAYCAAKHGLVGLTKVAALETATDGITVNAICPGWTETPILEPQIAARAAQLRCDHETAIRSLVAEKQPNQTLMPSAWIGETVAFLCSDAAAGMTGTALPVDGGWTAQ